MKKIAITLVISLALLGGLWSDGSAFNGRVAPKNDQCAVLKHQPKSLIRHGMRTNKAMHTRAQCGGGWTYDRYWSESHGPGHYDCLWYRTAPPYSAYVEHNC